MTTLASAFFVPPSRGALQRRTPSSLFGNVNAIRALARVVINQEDARNQAIAKLASIMPLVEKLIKESQA